VIVDLSIDFATVTRLFGQISEVSLTRTIILCSVITFARRNDSFSGRLMQCEQDLQIRIGRESGNTHIYVLGLFKDEMFRDK
jgi:hypothetical protein